MRQLTTILLSLLLFVPVSGSHALIFGADRRVAAAGEPGSLFGPIGVVYAPDQRAQATAFLIDDCHALTVQHVFGDRVAAKGRTAVVAFNVTGPRSNWTVVRASVLADGGLAAIRSSRPARSSDWAILTLSECVGRTYGHVRLSPRIPSAAEPIGIAGFPADRPLGQGVSVDSGCHIRARRDLDILHDCAALPGNSGSPLFRIVEEDGRPVLDTFAIMEAAGDVGHPMDARDNYPDGVWNVATLICGNAQGQAAAVQMRLLGLSKPICA